MIHTDEDDEFARIEHEAKLKGQPYYFEGHPTDSEKVIFRKPSRNLDDDDIQDYVRPWKSLTDQEIQKALGVTPTSSNWNMIMVLEWARKIEAALLEKNK